MPCTSRYNSVSIIVEKHKGEIKCFSVVGKGTEFNIEIHSKNKKLNGFVGKISLVRQLEKPEFFVLTLRLTHPTGYKQRKVI